MRNQDEIQRAHDVLAAIVLKEVPVPLDKQMRDLAVAQLDVLCWCLEHEHNNRFDGVLDDLQKIFKHLGIEETRAHSE